MAESFDKNMIDKDEYPQTAEIERRCVNIVADLFHAPSGRRRRRRLDDRFQRGGHAGRVGDEVEVAATSRGGGAVDRSTQHGDGFQCPGRVGEVLQVLGRRGPVRAGDRVEVRCRSRRRDGTASTRTRSG